MWMSKCEFNSAALTTGMSCQLLIIHWECSWITVNNRYIREFSNLPLDIHRYWNGGIHCMIYLLWNVYLALLPCLHHEANSCRTLADFLVRYLGLSFSNLFSKYRKTSFFSWGFSISSFCLIPEAQKHQKNKSKWTEKGFLKRDLSQTEVIGNQWFLHEIQSMPVCCSAGNHIEQF